MFSKPYHFLINSFLVATNGSYKKALSLGMDHLAKLIANQADAVVAAMLATFDPVMQAFLTAQQNLDTALGDYKGDTQSVESLFDELNNEKLAYWEGQLFYHFPKGSVEATQLMPKGRGAFQSGTYEQRILAIKTFGDKCALIPVLVPLSVNVLAFHTQIASARALQQSDGEGQTAALRDLRETARVALCEEMYGDMALLVHHYRTDPLQVERFFDLGLLRQKSEDGSEAVIASGIVTHAQTGAIVANASVKFILSDTETIEVQTDSKGEFEVELGIFTEETNITLEVNAAGFKLYTSSGTIMPNEDVEFDVKLVPLV